MRSKYKPMPDRNETATGLAEINGARIAYDVTGEGPALVLIHAGIADRRMWDDQIPAFSRYHQVVRYDLRGFGGSTMPPEPYAHHEDLAGLLRHLGISQAHVLGISMGGHVAIDFTLSQPEMVKSLIRVNSGIGEVTPSDVLTRAWDEMETAEAAGRLSDVIELEVKLWVDGPNRKSPSVNQAVRDRVREMNTTIFERIAEHEAANEIPLAPRAIDRLAEIHVPTLIVVGEEDVPDVHEVAAIMEATIEGLRKVVIPGAAHMVSMEQPEAFNRVVLEFLAQL